MWQFYLDVTKFAVAFYVVCLVFLSPFSAALAFGIFGTFIGLIGFNQFHKNEYYTYHNLGYTKNRLIAATFIFNLLLCLPLMGLGALLGMLFLMAVLQLDNATKTFGQKEILKNVSFQLKTGEILGIFGRNGSGKSTLLKILFVTLKADSLDLKIDGKSFRGTCPPFWRGAKSSNSRK